MQGELAVGIVKTGIFWQSELVSIRYLIELPLFGDASTTFPCHDT